MAMQDAAPRILGPDAAGKSFISSLRYEDLRRLRAVVKAVHKARAKGHGRAELDDQEADKIIEALGPRVIEKRLKQIVDEKWMDKIE